MAKKNENPNFVMMSVSAVYQLLLPTFCACCFWMEKSSNGPKFDIGIRAGALMAVDKISKVWLQNYMRLTDGQMPPSFNLPGRFEEVKTDEGKDLTWRNFFYRFESLGFGLRATPDFVLRNLKTREVHFLDFKQSSNLEAISYYRAQVAAEKVIAYKNGWGNIGKGVIVFTVPNVDHMANIPSYDDRIEIREDFRCFDVEMEEGEVMELARNAAAILRLPSPPASNCACKKCESIASMIPHFQARQIAPVIDERIQTA